MTEIKGPDIDSLYVQTLSKIKNEGNPVGSVKDKFSIGSCFGQKERPTKEIIGCSIILGNPLARLLYNKKRNFDLHFALGHFVWNIAGSNMLDAISFYNEKGIEFSDDKRTVYGNSYGRRLFKTPIGEKSQMQSIIERIKQDPASRRTYASILQPEDNLTKTKDVPCATGVQYFVRESKLYAITYMRSNSAALVLPYNIFLFTMIQELLARELNVGLGDYIHICGSLHYYDDEEPLVQNILSAGTETPMKEPMKPMPDHTTLSYLSKLIAFDNDIRTLVYHSSSPKDRKFNVDYWINRAKELDDYWSQVAYVLMCYALKKMKRTDLLSDLLDLLNPEYRYFMEKIEATH